MKAFTVQDLLKESLNMGFSLDSISIATQLPVDRLQEIADGSFSFLHENTASSAYLEDTDFCTYLAVFLMQLLQVSPLETDFFLCLMDSLTNHFKISYDAIANYLELSRNDLELFRNFPEKLPNKHEIELKLMHLFTTFIRDRRFS